MRARGRVKVSDTDDGATVDDDGPSQPLGIVVLELLLRIVILASKAAGTGRTGVVDEDDLVAAAHQFEPLDKLSNEAFGGKPALLPIVLALINSVRDRQSRRRGPWAP